MPEARPLFLLSLPRSGSTFAQNLIATNFENIETGPEPWIVPLLLQTRDDLSFSLIGSASAVAGVEQYLTSLDGLFADFISSFYKKVCADDKWFLDKTPRNAVYAEFIARTFGLDSCMVLVRQPSDVVLSYFDTFCKGRPDPFSGLVDFVIGTEQLMMLVDHGVSTIRYEDIQMRPEAILEIVDGKCDSLRRVTETNLERIDERLLSGVMGDPKFRRFIRPNSKKRSPSIVKLLIVWWTVRLTPLYDLQRRFYSKGPRRNASCGVRFRDARSLGLIDLVFFFAAFINAALNGKILFHKFRAGRFLYWVR